MIDRLRVTAVRVSRLCGKRPIVRDAHEPTLEGERDEWRRSRRVVQVAAQHDEHARPCTRDGVDEHARHLRLRKASFWLVVHLRLEVRREHLLTVARALRDDERLRFELCCGVSGVHYPLDAGRELHAFYPLLSITHNRRVQVEVACPDADPHVPSLYSVYPTTDWHERETYDFFGIVFDGHPALTRIEMPDDWVGHPQRKDYPLGGIPVEYHGAQIPPPDQRRSYN